MVKYLIIDCEQITCERSEQISIFNPINNFQYIYESTLGKSITSYSTLTYYLHSLSSDSKHVALVIENENFEEFSFLDELKNYEKEKYKLLLNFFGELEQIYYTDDSSTIYDSMIINGTSKRFYKYPFQYVIFKNCLNLKKISGILEAHQQIYDTLIYKNADNFQQIFTYPKYFIWNCPNFVFDFKPIEYNRNIKSHNIIANSMRVIFFHISNNFKLIYKYTDVLLQHILHQQHEQIKSLTNDNQNLKKENETNNNIILEMANRMSSIETKLNLSLLKSTELTENQLMLLEDELSNKLSKKSIIYNFYK